MNFLGKYLSNTLEKRVLQLSKVLTPLDIKASILIDIFKRERIATKEMLSTLAKTLKVYIKEIERIKVFSYLPLEI